MDRNDELEFSLDDIMREFGSEPVSPEQQETTALPVRESEPDEPVKVYTPRSEQVTGDTIRLDQIQKAVSTAAEKSLGDTAVFQPVYVDDEEDSPEPEVPDSPTIVIEPFSEEWEPEYEEPMGEYPVPPPIVYRPKSRLKELRQKLVSGPEQRYYSLMELGVGKLQLSMFLCILVLIVTAGVTVMYAWGALGEDRLRLVVFVQFLGMLLSALLGCYRLMEGISDLLRLRFTVNSLLVFTFVACCVDGVLCLQEQRISVSAAFILEMVMAMWATYDRRSTEIGQMDTLRRATNLDAMVSVPEDYEGSAGLRMAQGEVEHFMDHYDGPSGPEQVLNWYALATLVVGLAVGILAGVRHGFSAGVELCAAALVMGMPATAFISMPRPMAILEKRLHKLGAVLCGWQGVKAVGRRCAFLLEDEDLFPAGSAKLNGVKFYGDRDPDQIVSYATALIKANGGALVPLFEQMLASRGGFVCTAEHLNRYNGGGIGGEIGDDAVLVGTLAFMHDMGVEIGSGTRVSQAVYCAIDGQMAGVFAVSYSKSRSSAAGVQTLCGYRGLTPVVACDDFMVNEGFLRGKFGINTRTMAFPAYKVKEELRQREADPDAPVVALMTKPGLAPKAFAVTGARMLKSALKTGVVVHMVGGILGLLIMAALAWVGVDRILTPANILLYELIWMLPGFLITEWTRTL